MIATFFLIVPVLLTSLFLPIYSDELVYKWFSSRQGPDDGISINLFPHCSDLFDIKTPILFQLSHLANGWLYSDLSNPLKLRYLGMLNFTAWLLLFFLLCKKLFLAEGKNRFLISLPLIFLGTLPLMMTLNRPEQPMLLTLTAALFLPLAKPTHVFEKIILVALFLLLTMCFFSQHPKGLFFAPFFLVVAFFVPLHPRTRLLLGGWIFILSINLYSFSTRQAGCPNNPDLQKAFSAALLSPADFINLPWFTFKQMLRNSLGFHGYFSAIFFSDSTEAAWLPPTKISKVGHFLNLTLSIFWGAWLVSMVCNLTTKIKELLIYRKTDFRTAAALSLSFPVISTCFLQQSKNFYNSSLFLPVLVLAGNLVPNKFASPISFKKVPIAILFFALSFLSISTISVDYLGANIADWKKGGQLEKQYLSFSAYNWGSIKSQVHQLAKKCNLENESKVKHLVVDDITYPFFIKTKEPYHALYVTGYWSMGIGDLKSFLKKRNSGGLIAQCKFFSEKVVSESHRAGDFCCLPAFN